MAFYHIKAVLANKENHLQLDFVSGAHLVLKYYNNLTIFNHVTFLHLMHNNIILYNKPQFMPPTIMVCIGVGMAHNIKSSKNQP